MKCAYLFSKLPDFSDLEYYPLTNHLWSEEYPHFVNVRASLCAVKGEGIVVSFIADEPSPQAVFLNRDDAVYNDSCVEFFFQPFADDERYVNFEINPNGAYLCAIGNDRFDRQFLKDLSTVQPDVSASLFSGGWSARVVIPEQLISDIYGREFYVSELEYVRANFYKCGDMTDAPHYSSMFLVGTEQPDFHRSEYFQKIYFQNERSNIK